MARALRLAALVTTCAAVVLTETAAASAPGLAHEDCLGNAGGACALLPGAPLDDPAALAVSPDGKSVYVVSATGNSLERFSLSDVRGHLRYSGCLNNDGAHHCTALRGAPLNRPVAVRASPDGKSVYVLSWAGGSIEEFGVQAGGLEYVGCHNDTGTQGCEALPYGPLLRPLSLAVSPDSRTVYVTSTDAGSIASFSAPSPGGRLVYAGCISVRAQRGCVVPQRLRGVDHLVVSADGASAYGIAWGGNVLAQFRVQQGQLVFASCAGAVRAVRRPRASRSRTRLRSR